MDYSLGASRAPKWRLIVARQFKREFVLSPVGTTEPMPVATVFGVKQKFPEKEFLL